jgi:Putative prokaryotic signal transducing protein
MADERKIVRLASVPTEREAALLIAMLEEKGIKSTMSGQATAGFRAEAPGWVQLLVFEDDFPRAREIIESVDAGDSEVDWSRIDVGHPEDSEME